MLFFVSRHNIVVNMIKTSYDLLVSELHSSHLASVLDGQLDGGVVHQLADLQGARVVIRFASQSKEFEQGFNLKKNRRKKHQLRCSPKALTSTNKKKNF